METIVIKIIISALVLMILNSSVDGRFIKKVEEPSEIVKTCQKGCSMKFPLKSDNTPNWDKIMCTDYCSLLFKDRKKKVITTLMCADVYCVSTTEISAFFSVPFIDNSYLFSN